MIEKLLFIREGRRQLLKQPGVEEFYGTKLRGKMIAKMIIAILTIATGAFALVKPTAIYSFTGLTASNVRGISEIRAIFGGLLIALGAAPLFLGLPAYQTLGVGYLGIALVRLASIIFDKSYASSNWISLAIEVLFGLVLILR